MNPPARDLARRIIEAKRAYYEGRPLMSDAEYDRLEQQLRAADPKHPVLSLVGTDISGDVPHDPPMLSAEKLDSIDEVIPCARGERLAWGYKVDGLSVKLVYVDAQLVKAATRGDGHAGEDVTAQCFRLGGVPHQLLVDGPGARGIIEVRGEVYMPISKFKAISQAGSFKSPRNLATGTLKAKDPSLVSERGLRFMAWDLIDRNEPMDIDKKIASLRAYGFDCADQGIINPAEASNVFARALASRNAIDFEMDGLVFKVVDAGVQASLGATDHHPRWLAAVKFPATEDTTIVVGIDWQVGRTGKLTPVARLEAVELGGATISNATCHNAKFVEDNDLAPGDKVFIVRSGDVIPKINAVAEKGPGHAKIPGTCPECGSPVRSDGTNIFCTNAGCGEMGYQRLMNYVSVAGIEQVGEKSLRRLWDEKGVRTPAALYSISKEQLAAMFGKNGEKMWDQLHGKMAMPLATFLEALGIPRLSKVTAKAIAREIPTLDGVTGASSARLEAIQGIGPETSASIVAAFKDKRIYQDLLDAGVTIVPPRAPSPDLMGNGGAPSPFAGKRIYITGSVPGYKKDDLEALVTGVGGTWTSSVSKNMDLLVVGNNAGPAKLEKAKSLGVKTMDAEAFLRLVGK
ncbi:MAG: NAD-dependent DNA ligase LigA [Candidatus Lokiarchaeota archaeon]|nr:NAD-dependent DNA ligase LigA [Candidatus Lokiarchaeota archaeon]